MITYFPNATPEEQLNLWYNGNEDEVALAKYISGVIDGISEESYARGYEDGSGMMQVMHQDQNMMSNYFKKDQEQHLLDEYTAYKEQEEQLVILEEIRQYINEQEGYDYESN